MCNNTECSAIFSRSRLGFEDKWKLSGCKLQTKYMKQNAGPGEWQNVIEGGVLLDERIRKKSSIKPTLITSGETKPLSSPPSIIHGSALGLAKDILGKINKISTVAVSPSGNYFAVVLASKMYFFNAQNEILLIKELGEESSFSEHFRVSDYGHIFYQWYAHRCRGWRIEKYNNDLKSFVPSGEFDWLNDLSKYVFPDMREVSDLAFSPNYKVVAYGSASYDRITFLTPLSPKNQYVLEPSFGAGNARLKFSQNGKKLVAWSGRALSMGRIGIFECSEEPALFWNDIVIAKDIAITETKVFVMNEDKIFIYDILGNPENELKIPSNSKWIPNNIKCISASGNVIFVSCDDQNIYAFTNDGTLLWKYKTESKIVDIEAALNGGKVVAVSDSDIFIFNKNED